jgi:hypothetical protein
MAILKNNEYKTVVWGSKNNFITGLDPLGLQITSEATYATLLPGITNLTNRIRYYGFYCWLLDFYSKNIRDINQQKQNNFIRKAELLMAILVKTQNSNFTQVTGSQFAVNLIETKTESVYNLTDGAVKDGDKKTYWKFSSGAFGQYYAGAMHEIGLTLRNDNGNFICSNKNHHDLITGSDLANAFEKQLSIEAKETFLSSVDQGKLREEDIAELHINFGIDKIDVNSEEYALYLNILSQIDHPFEDIMEEIQISLHRKNTIKYLLQQASKEKSFTNWGDLINNNYKNIDVENESNTTLSLWYFFKLNELWLFGAGSCLWACLMEMELKSTPTHIQSFITEMVNKSEIYLKENFNITVNESFQLEITKLNLDETKETEIIRQNVKIKEVDEVLGKGIAMIGSIYNGNKRHINKLKVLSQSISANRDGNVLEFFTVMDLFKGTFKEFLYLLLQRHIIYRHQFVAIRKTGNGTQSSLKFLLEENYIRGLDIFPPIYSSPRLDALIHMMQDLSLIKNDNTITLKGTQYLKEIK